MIRQLILGGALVALLAGPASANMMSGRPTQIISFSPPNPTVLCNAAPGAFVSAVQLTRPTGAQLQLSGDTADFELSSSTPPANILVGIGGISSSGFSCATIPPNGNTADVTVTSMP
jgi:hypothetical protein